jgi:hypothetical protein
LSKASTTVVTRAAPTLQWWRMTLLVVISLCAYTQIPLLTGGRMLVPSFPTVALTPLLLLTVWPNISKSDGVFLPKIAFVLLLSLAFSPGHEYVGEKFFALIQCCMAIGVAVLIVRLMQQIRRELLERALLVLWLLIVAGAALEVLGVIGAISDSFRVWAYGDAYTLYGSDLRDINLVGWPRPKLFSVEPSHVTKVFIASINAWLLVRVSWAKVATVAGATLVMLVIMGSPMLLASVALTLLILMWDRRASLRARVTMILSTLLIAVLFGVYYGGSSYSAVAARLTNVGEPTVSQRRSRGSEEGRLIYPYVILIETWSRWPLFGVGLGGKEILADQSKTGASREAAMGNNVMAEMGTYLGSVGAVLFLYALMMQAVHSGVRRVGLFLLIIVLFSQLMAGMESFRYWGFIALLWGALAVADSNLDPADARLALNKHRQVHRDVVFGKATPQAAARLTSRNGTHASSPRRSGDIAPAG